MIPRPNPSAPVQLPEWKLPFSAWLWGWVTLSCGVAMAVLPQSSEAAARPHFLPTLTGLLTLEILSSGRWTR